MQEQNPVSGSGTLGFTRLINFTDAVTAIAITLLILPLVDEASSIGNLGPGAFLAENVYGLFAFGLSFVVISRFWLGHHRMYEQVIGYTPGLIGANLLWLLCVVFLPFPTELLNTADRGDPLTNGLYIGTLSVASGSSLVQQLIISRTPAIRAPGTGPVPVLPLALLLALMLAALVVSILFPAIGLWALLLLFLQAPMHHLVLRTRKGHS